MFAGCGGGDSDDDGSALPDPTATQQTAADTSTTGPAGTPPPTSTSAPVPTNTPEPPSTPEPVALALSGSGQTVTDTLDLTAGIFIAHLVHSGTGNFVVSAIDSGGGQVVLVDRDGGYRPLTGGTTYSFDVDADGDWTMDIEPIAPDPAAVRTFAGEGDRVSGTFDGPGEGPWDIGHNGSAAFSVRAHCTGSGSTLLLEDVGSVGATETVDLDGTCYWEVQGDGGWSLIPR